MRGRSAGLLWQGPFLMPAISGRKLAGVSARGRLGNSVPMWEGQEPRQGVRRGSLPVVCGEPGRTNRGSQHPAERLCRVIP
jgi:hypothetical protein